MTQASIDGRLSLTERVCDALEGIHDERRQRVARALHDSVAQSLSAAVMNLTLVQRSAQELGIDRAQALDRAISLLTESCREVSELSHELSPAFFGRRALGETLRELCTRRFSRYRIDLGFCDGGEAIIADAASLRAAAAFIELGLCAADPREPVSIDARAEGARFSLGLRGSVNPDRDVAAILAAIERQVARGPGAIGVAPLEPGMPWSLTATFPCAPKDRGP